MPDSYFIGSEVGRLGGILFAPVAIGSVREFQQGAGTVES